MSTPDLLGAFEGDFMKKSLDVYVNLANQGLRYIGKTMPEKTIRFPREYMEFRDGTPRTLYIIDYLSVGLTAEFTFMQICDPNWLAVALDSDIDTSGTVYDYAFFGSNPGAIDKREWRFVGETRDARLMELVIRQGMIRDPGDMVTGGDDYASQSYIIEATQDTAISTASRDLGYFRIGKRTFS